MIQRKTSKSAIDKILRIEEDRQQSNLSRTLIVDIIGQSQEQIVSQLDQSKKSLQQTQQNFYPIKKEFNHDTNILPEASQT